MIIVPHPGKSAFETAINSIRSKERVVVIGDDESKDLMEEQLEEAYADPEKSLEEANLISAEDWFSEQIEKFIVGHEVEIGDWPTEPFAKSDWRLNRDILSRNHAHVARMTVEGSWQIPAMLCFGGGNACPIPAVHCAIWKYWEKKFHAHIVAMTHDVIEAKVYSPPTSKEQALELAKQQYVYCSDIVSQSVGSIASLAASLLNDDKWYFWWD